MCRCFCMRKAGFVTFMCVCNQFSYLWRITTPLVLVMSLIMLVLHTLVLSSLFLLQFIEKHLHSTRTPKPEHEVKGSLQVKG